MRLALLACFSSRTFSRAAVLFFSSFFGVGELFITHTWTYNERNHKCQTEGHPQPKLQATLTTFLLLLLFFWVGELFITHTRTCNDRNHKCQTEGHPQPKLQATLTTWVKADTKVCKEATCQAKQADHKAVVQQPTAKPVHFQQTKHHLCLNQSNIAVKTTTSRAYDVHCKPKGSSSHHNLNQWMKHTRESTAHIRACHRACQKKTCLGGIPHSKDSCAHTLSNLDPSQQPFEDLEQSCQAFWWARAEATSAYKKVWALDDKVHPHHRWRLLL